MEAIFKRYQNVPDDRFSELVARAWNGDAGGAVASARRLVAHEARESDFWPEACEILGWCLYVNDDLHESTRWLQEARSRALASQQWVIVAVAAAELSLVAGERRQSSEQQHFAGEAYACLVEHGLAKTPGYEGVVHTARGAALAAQGQLGDAREPLEHGLETRPPTRFQVLDAIVPLIPVVRALGDREGAYALLEEAQTVLSDCRDPGGFRRRLAAVARLSGPRSVRYGGQVGDLSTAELRVLELLDAGRSQREIGRELYVSFNTVHGHVKSIYRKLGVGSRQEALAKARSKAPALPRLDRVDRVGRQRS
jgi:LuxR family maltose regulon positive regulatory protein